MDKPLKLEQAKLIAKDYSERIIPLETNILDALGVTRGLQETVQDGNDAIQNIELLENTLKEIKSTLESNGVEVTTCKVGDLSGYINEIAGKIPPLQEQIQSLTSENTRLEGENETLTTQNATLTQEKTELETELSGYATQLEELI